MDLDRLQAELGSSTGQYDENDEDSNGSLGDRDADDEDEDADASV
jgi:hypothetical protein